MATLTANTSPVTPLHQRNVFVIIKKAGVTGCSPERPIRRAAWKCPRGY
ncbi:MAG: hypothetical protein M3365_00490 [Gemmatimonadota bacterium]|nr:hypothetical protein [Gemmatimonadota bacterium]